MTTERNGMSLEQVLMILEAAVSENVGITPQTTGWLAEAVKSHLSRDAVVSDFPMGAIENGRVFADRVENTDLSCIAGDLHLCVDWHEFRRCFEHLANWALTESFAARHAAVPDGYVLVPVEPTAKMLNAAIDSFIGFDNEEQVDAVWEAMLAKAMLAQRDGGHHG